MHVINLQSTDQTNCNGMELEERFQFHSITLLSELNALNEINVSARRMAYGQAGRAQFLLLH